MFSQSCHESFSRSFIPLGLTLFCLGWSSKSTNFVSDLIAHDGFVFWITCSSCFMRFICLLVFALCRPYFWIYHPTLFRKSLSSYLDVSSSVSCFQILILEWNAPACKTCLNFFERLTYRVPFASFWRWL